MSEKTWTEADIPNQNGRVAIVTGANSGLGYETVRALAAKGAKVVMAVRTPAKGEEAADRIRQVSPSADLRVQELDLTSLDSVRAAAADLRRTYPRIDLLINNAGVMFTPRQETKDGFELQFGVNHLAHFALTGLLIGNILPVPGSRIVTVSSHAHRMRAAIRFDDLQSQHSYDRIAAYGQSKLANLLFTYQLQHRLVAAGAATIAAAAHPGAANTDLGRSLPAPMRLLIPLVGPMVSQPAAVGALPSLRAATDPDVFGGQYFGPGGRGERRGAPVAVASSEQSHDLDLQQRLWSVSQALTGVTFSI